MNDILRFEGETRWLSNFQRVRFEYKGIMWETTEHAYQAMKALNTRDFLAVLNCNTPGQAKSMGRSITIDPLWDSIKLEVMYEINFAKFTQNIWLANALLRTGNVELIEGNTWNDTYWGVCNDIGENNLGKILMQIRDEIR